MAVDAAVSIAGGALVAVVLMVEEVSVAGDGIVEVVSVAVPTGQEASVALPVVAEEATPQEAGSPEVATVDFEVVGLVEDIAQAVLAAEMLDTV